MGCPAAVSSLAKFRVDFSVHRIGDSGSPRVPGSINDSNASIKPGSATFAGFRPPPAVRTRFGPAGFSSFSSLIPRQIVDRDAPVARWTSVIPPRPHACASVASAARRSRSFSRGSKMDNRIARAARSPDRSTTLKIIPDKQGKCICYLITAPKVQRGLLSGIVRVEAVVLNAGDQQRLHLRFRVPPLRSGILPSHFHWYLCGAIDGIDGTSVAQTDFPAEDVPGSVAVSAVFDDGGNSSGSM